MFQLSGVHYIQTSVTVGGISHQTHVGEHRTEYVTAAFTLSLTLLIPEL